MNNQNNIHTVDNLQVISINPLETIDYINMISRQAYFTNNEIAKLNNMLKNIRSYLNDEEEIKKLQTLFKDIFYCNRLENIHANIKWLEQEMEKLAD
jgi:hypothetical protein